MFFLIKFSAIVKTDFIFKFYFKNNFKYLSIYMFVSFSDFKRDSEFDNIIVQSFEGRSPLIAAELVC